jgi:hypothetical protein
MNENNIVDNNKEDINNILIKNNSNNEFLDNYSKKSDNENTEILSEEDNINLLLDELKINNIKLEGNISFYFESKDNNLKMPHKDRIEKRKKEVKVKKKENLFIQRILKMKKKKIKKLILKKKKGIK